MPDRDSRHHNDIAHAIIRAAYSVQQNLGPGPKEQLHQQMLGDGVASLGLEVAVEPAVPPVVDGRRCSWLYPDLVVENTVVVECKLTPDWLSDADLAQVLTYLAVCQLPVGMLLNSGLARLEYRRTLPPRRPEEWMRRVAPYLRRYRR